MHTTLSITRAIDIDITDLLQQDNIDFLKMNPKNF